jgi:hypothetical protein
MNYINKPSARNYPVYPNGIHFVPEFHTGTYQFMLQPFTFFHFSDGISRFGESGSSVRLRAGRSGHRGSIPGRRETIFSPASVFKPALGSTQHPVQWVPGVLSPGLKRGLGVTDHSTPSSAVVKNE